MLGGGFENGTWMAIRGKQAVVGGIHAIANRVRQWLTKELPCTSLIEEDQTRHGVKSKSNSHHESS